MVAFGLAPMKASSEAETVAAPDVWDDDGEAEPGWDGEPVPEGDPVPEKELAEDEPGADGEGDTAPLEALPELMLDAGALGEAEDEAEDAEDEAEDEAEGEAEVEEADGEGVGDGDGGFGVGVGEGVGEGVLAAGSTWHLVTVSAPALVEAPGLGEVAASCTTSARAAPGQPASPARVRKTPASRLRTVARACARRMKIALLIGVTVCSSWDSEATR